MKGPAPDATGVDESLARLAGAPERSALIVDFDGTLAPIVAHPPDAVPLPGAVTALRRLAAGPLGRTAVVSGRPVAFLTAALPVDGLELFGQYGVERRTATGDVVVADDASRWRGAVARAAARAEAALPGLFVERKGELAVALHWRNRPDLAGAAAELARRLAAEEGLRFEPGRLNLELRPPLDVDKGDAVTAVADGAAVAVMLGDDRGDVAAFEALGRLVAAGRLGHAVRVAVLSAETPPELLAGADATVEGPEAVAALLTRLADRLS